MRTRETREVKNQERRSKRVPIHEQRRNILTISGKDENYVYRIVNDVGNRVQRFIDGGWELAPSDNHEVVGDRGVVNNNTSLGGDVRMSVGDSDVAVLMRIRKELYEEDQRAKELNTRAKEKAILHKSSGEDGTYGEISIEKTA